MFRSTEPAPTTFPPNYRNALALYGGLGEPLPHCFSPQHETLEAELSRTKKKLRMAVDQTILLSRENTALKAELAEKDRLLEALAHASEWELQFLAHVPFGLDIPACPPSLGFGG